MRFRYASDQSLLVYFGDEISLEAHYGVRKLLLSLEQDSLTGVCNLHPAYCSLLVQFDPCRVNHEEMERALRDRIAGLDAVALPAARTVEIPVNYGGESGPDLESVAALHGLTTNEVVQLHSGATYIVYFLGFVPGFAYMGGLPNALSTPRLPAPRTRVPAGSVGIAGNQTGVYPFVTPGGWRLIGKTPLQMFRADRENMSLLEIGDQVRFRPA
jgi:KipI family sensor histidine kinase inhibitor